MSEPKEKKFPVDNPHHPKKKTEIDGDCGAVLQDSCMGAAAVNESEDPFGGGGGALLAGGAETAG